MTIAVSAIPDRFSILENDYKEKALESLRTNGAVILTNVVPNDDETWKATAEQTPCLLFPPAELRLSKHQASQVHVEHHGTPGEMNGKGLLPHTDGYVWGDRNPDLVILLCEQPTEGGFNYLIDGERTIQRLDEDEKTLDILKKAKVDHTERPEHGFGSMGIESIVPIFRREERRIKHGSSWLDATTPLEDENDVATTKETSKGRLRWRRMIPLDFSKGILPMDGDTYMSCWKAMDEDGGEFAEEEVTEALKILDKGIFEETQIAPRFQLQQGECLIVDNYRMLHARESFRPNSETNKVNRKMWRVWSWTVESEGLPPGMTDERQATTVLEADSFISENKRLGIEVN